MTDKQKIFCDEYLKDCNGARAYKVAYPNVKSDNVAIASASRLLRNVNVKTYIDKHMTEMSDARIADANEIIRYLTSVLRGESESEVVVVEGIGDGCSEARKMKKKPDEKERLKAAELLGKRFAIFSQKTDVNIKGSVPVVLVDDIPKE